MPQVLTWLFALLATLENFRMTLAVSGVSNVHRGPSNQIQVLVLATLVQVVSLLECRASQLVNSVPLDHLETPLELPLVRIVILEDFQLRRVPLFAATACQVPTPISLDGLYVHLVLQAPSLRTMVRLCALAVQ